MVIYLLHGADRFRSTARLRELRRALDPDGFNGSSLDGQETDLDAVRAACDTLAFFGGGRCVDVRGLLTRWIAGKKGAEKTRSDGDPLEAFARYLPLMPATTSLLLWEPGLVELPAPLRRRLHDLGAKIERFDAPRGRELRAWAIAQAGELGATIRPDAVEALLDAVCPQGWGEALRGREAAPPDLAQIDSELRKLATATLDRVGVDAATITARDVATLTVGEVTSNVFDLIDAVVAGNVSLALARLRAALDDGVAPEAILPLLAGQFGTLARLRAAGGVRANGSATAQRLGISPYRLQHASRQLAQLGEERVTSCLRIVLEADRAIKTGRAPRSDDALYWAILELCRAGPQVPLADVAGGA